MTRAEYLELIEWIEKRWIGTRAWANADELYYDFSAYGSDVAMSAARRLFAEGLQGAPSPSKLMAAIRDVAANTPGAVALPQGPHRHVFEHREPFHLYGDLHSMGKGPGERFCVLSECMYSIACHCELCRKDRMYAEKARDLTADEMKANKTARGLVLAKDRTTK